MDNVQNSVSYINIPSSQTYISYSSNDISNDLTTEHSVLNRVEPCKF
jgi:hypothetical protein